MVLRAAAVGLGLHLAMRQARRTQAFVFLLQRPVRAAFPPPGALTVLPTGLRGSPCPSASSGASSWRSCCW